MCFLDLQIKSYRCLKFLGEVWAGWACAGANEKDLTNHKKIWKQDEGGKGARGYKNGGPTRAQLAAAGHWLALPWATAAHNGRRPIVVRRPRAAAYTERHGFFF
jgi:hypothetical protein